MPAGHLRGRQLFDLVREIVQRPHAEGHADALHRAEEVDGDRHVEARGPLEKQPWTAARRFRRAVGDGADLEIRAHRLGDSGQLALFVEGGDELFRSLNIFCSRGPARSRGTPARSAAGLRSSLPFVSGDDLYGMASAADSTVCPIKRAHTTLSILSAIRVASSSARRPAAPSTTGVP